MTIKDLSFSDIKVFGEKLRKYLWEQYNNVPEQRKFKKGEVPRCTHIRVLYGMLPDWVIEIAELSFKDFQKEIDWNPEYLLSLEFSKPIL